MFRANDSIPAAVCNLMMNVRRVRRPFILGVFLVWLLFAGSGFQSAVAQSPPTLSGLSRNGSAQFTNSLLRLTDGQPFEHGSAFISEGVSTFQTQFNFQLSAAQADGFAFVIQNQGADALGGEGGNLGYVGITRSIAVAFDLFSNNGENNNSTYLLSSGSPSSGVTDLTSSGIDLHSGHPFHATISYTGALLTVTVKDLMTGAQAQQVYQVDLYASLGSATAFVGFTGGTGGLTATQDISAWTFSPLSESAATGSNPINYPNGFPNETGGLTLSGAAFVKNELQLTDGNLFESRAAWFTSPVDVRAFSTDFSFQALAAAADGFTFTIQNDPAGPTAIGVGGGQLGYGGIKASVAIKFDFFDNAGEGRSSTGFYVNGASPTVPSLDTNFSINSGDIINAHITYDGSVLTLMLFDNATRYQYRDTASTSVNIPAIVGASFANVGFTAGTGGYSSTQNILNWTYGYNPSSVGTADLTFGIASSYYFESQGLYNRFALVVDNLGTIPSSGAITVSDILPPGLTAASISGVGWDCSVATVTCTTTSIAGAGQELPPIFVYVNVDPAYAGTVQNLATVSGGGEVNTANDTQTDIDYIVQAPLVSLSFSPATIPLGARTIATLMLTNPPGNTVPLSVSFLTLFPFPTGFTDPQYLGASCSGGQVQYDGHLTVVGVPIPINGNCTYKVGVTSTTAGTFTASVSGLTSNGGTPPPASAALIVTATPSSAVATPDAGVLTVTPVDVPLLTTTSPIK